MAPLVSAPEPDHVRLAVGVDDLTTGGHARYVPTLLSAGPEAGVVRLTGADASLEAAGDGGPVRGVGRSQLLGDAGVLKGMRTAST